MYRLFFKMILLLQNILEKVRKRSYKNCDKVSVFKAKWFGKRKTILKRDKYSSMIIITQNNKIGSWSLTIVDTIYNYPLTLLGIYPIYWQLVHIDKVKELIRVSRNSKGGRTSKANRDEKVGRADKGGRVSRTTGGGRVGRAN